MAIAEDAGPRHALARPPAPGQELRPVAGGAAVGGAAVLQTRPLLLISGTKYSFSNFYVTLLLQPLAVLVFAFSGILWACYPLLTIPVVSNSLLVTKFILYPEGLQRRRQDLDPGGRRRRPGGSEVGGEQSGGLHPAGGHQGRGAPLHRHHGAQRRLQGTSRHRLQAASLGRGGVF